MQCFHSRVGIMSSKRSVKKQTKPQKERKITQQREVMEKIDVPNGKVDMGGGVTLGGKIRKGGQKGIKETKQIWGWSTFARKKIF